MPAITMPGAAEPMRDLNTTPLIDVMLVLLVMMILSIPVAANILPIDLPNGSSSSARINRDSNEVTITAADAIAWNGTGVSEAQLAGLLHHSLSLPVEPELKFHPDPQASYDASAHVLRTIKASGVTRLGFVGNSQYADFDRPSR